MKLKTVDLSRYYPLITIPTGWAALIVSVFFRPALAPTLAVFKASAQGALRTAGVLGILALGFLFLLGHTIDKIDQFFGSGKSFSFLLPVHDSLNKQPIDRYWLSLLLLISLLLLQLSLRGATGNDLDDLFFATIRPVLVWGFIYSLLIFLSGVVRSAEDKSADPSFWKMVGGLFIVFFGAGAFLQISGYGYGESSRIAGNFDLTGYPILGYQVLLAAGVSLLVTALMGVKPKGLQDKLTGRRWIFDLVICLALFLAAAVIWKAIPIQTHMFYDQPRPPNYEYYPNSDSNIYDRTALNLITAGRFQSYTYRYDEYVGRRPYLALYLALLHTATGSNYPEMISIQQVVFSLLPVLVYMLATALHSRSSGILSGLLIIIRERNGLVLSDSVTGVHTQLLMSEIPTMFLLILFLALLSKALLGGKKQHFWLLSAGGVLGVAMLIRQEVIALLPFILLGIFLTGRKHFKFVVKQAAWILAAVMLVVSPWVFRNWQSSGKLYLDVPGNKMYSIYQTFGIPSNWWERILESDDGVKNQLDEKIVVGEQELDQDQLASPKIGLVWPANTPYGSGGEGEANRLDHVLNHFTNQLVQSVVYLPSYPLGTDIDFLSKMVIGKLDRYYGGLFYSPQSYAKELPYWWPDWNGKIPSKSLLPVATVVLLIAVGYSAASKKDKSTAGLPLFAYLGYISIYALVRGSGGRFLQEIDWVTQVYFSIGLMTVLNRVFVGSGSIKTFNQEENLQKEDPSPASQFSPVANPALLLLILFVGIVPVAVERIIPSAYPAEAAEPFGEALLQTPHEILDSHEQETLLGFLEGDGEIFLGKAYYPRHFLAGENLVDIRPEVLGLYEDRYSSDRTEFLLIGTKTLWTILRRIEQPEELPNGSEVFVLGCQQDGTLDAVAIFVISEGSARRIYWRDNMETTDLDCPLQSPEYSGEDS